MNNKVYVSMTDKSKSNFDDRIKKIVIVCNNLEEAQIVIDNARNKKEMKDINIRLKKPYYPSNFYYVQYKDKIEYPEWFVR